MGPHVQRAFLGKHSSKLRRDKGSWDKERQESEDPEHECRWPGKLHGRSVRYEQDEGYKDHHEVERCQHPSDQSGRHLLRDHLPRAGYVCCHETPSQEDRWRCPSPTAPASPGPECEAHGARYALDTFPCSI